MYRCNALEKGVGASPCVRPIPFSEGECEVTPLRLSDRFLQRMRKHIVNRVDNVPLSVVILLLANDSLAWMP
jgi:hypothetical protein